MTDATPTELEALAQAREYARRENNLNSWREAFNAGWRGHRAWAQQQKAEEPKRDPNICLMCKRPFVGASTAQLCPGPKDYCKSTYIRGEA